jgi:hypothetical protein
LSNELVIKERKMREDLRQLQDRYLNLGGLEFEPSVANQKEYSEIGNKIKELQDNLRAMPKAEKKGVPDAPYKEDWYQLALRRAIKEAVDGGYDRIALVTGERVNERFSLTKHIDRIDYNKNPDGTYNMSAIRYGDEVFAKENINEKELSGLVGTDVAKKIIGGRGENAYDMELPDGLGEVTVRSLLDLELTTGGEGNKKYYNEVYPTYLQKFGKKYGATVGKTTVDVEGKNEPLRYMDITPAMREAFKTGIHMAKGGKVSFAPNIDAMRRELTKAK